MLCCEIIPEPGTSGSEHPQNRNFMASWHLLPHEAVYVMLLTWSHPWLPERSICVVLMRVTHTHPLWILPRLGQHDHLKNIVLKHFEEVCENDSPTWAMTHCTLCSSSWTDISSSRSQHSISGRGRSCSPPVFLSLYLYPSSPSSPRCLLTLPLHTNVPFS